MTKTFRQIIMENKTEQKFAISFIAYIIFIIFLFQKNPYDIVSIFPGPIIFLTLFIGFLMVMMMLFIKQRVTLFSDDKSGPTAASFFRKIITTFATIGMVAMIITLSLYFMKHTPRLTSSIMFLLNILIGIGLLTLIYKVAGATKSKKEDSSPTWMTLIKDMVFYIPCLGIQFVDYLVNFLKHEYNITSKPVWIILGLEIVFIFLRVVLPIIFKKILTHDGVHLLSEPQFLNSKSTIGTYKNLHKDKKNRYSYHYAISGWFYIDPQPPSTSGAYSKNTSLLNYGGKPNILYNGSTNTLLIKAFKNRNDEEIIYKTKNIAYQKWNHIVINYDRGTLDVFLNNKLVASVKNIVPYMTYDTLTVGEDPGINGGVCNVVYFDRVLTRNNISHLYNIYKNLTPPLL